MTSLQRFNQSFRIVRNQGAPTGRLIFAENVPKGRSNAEYARF